MSKEILTTADILKNIKKAFDSLSGDEIAAIHNRVCDREVEYFGDSQWGWVDEGEEEVVQDGKDRKNGLFGPEYKGEKF